VPKPPSGLLARPPAPAGARGADASAWRAAGAGWRPLFGDCESQGFSFAWHDFVADAELDWGRSFHPARLELCLNLDGHATLAGSRGRVELRPRMSVFYVQGSPPLMARRRAGDTHRFVTVEFTPAFLKQHLAEDAPHLHPSVQAIVRQPFGQSAVSEPQPMGAALLHLLESLRNCPVFKPAQAVWFRCKALELAARSFFQPPQGERLCTRQQRVACERADRVREILGTRLADPPSLEELGRLVGCSPSYLSRQFSEATGLTIQQFLRQARLERAAELLRGGGHNVTEAALEVGYNSLSHFTVAFRQTFGCCPGLYPIKALPGITLPQASPPTSGRG
jgi:AraC-like DNA-binding protein